MSHILVLGATSLKLCILHSGQLSLDQPHFQCSVGTWLVVAVFRMSVFLPHPCPRLSHLRCSNHSVRYSRPPNSPYQWQNQLWWRGKCLFIAVSYHLWPERIVWKRLLQDQIQKRGTTRDFKRVERKANDTQRWKCLFAWAFILQKSSGAPRSPPH